jgi:RNA-binding protein
MPGTLTNPQRKFLRGLAHSMPATIHLGKLGLTPNLLGSLDQALLRHELIKLRFTNLQDERKETSKQIQEQTQAVQVSMVGHTAIYYRPSPDLEKGRIVLPKAKRVV